MIASPTEIFSVLHGFNPWWSGARSQFLPAWRRVQFREISSWSADPPGGRALLLTGARRVGKTTLLLQLIDSLLNQGTPSQNILYVSLDHPLLKLAGLEATLAVWRELEPPLSGTEHLFLDEIQFAHDWQVWVKHQVDFQKHRRIAMTGSAIPLAREKQESGVGRWLTISVPTVSFYEFQLIKGLAHVAVPKNLSLRAFFDLSPQRLAAFETAGQSWASPFVEYLLRGGFPENALAASVEVAQKLLREDIIDKILKRDMTALFGVRRVIELERLFLYLCMHDGGLLHYPSLCSNLEMKRPTVINFMDLLEAAHLVHRLRPFGYGKEVLRGSEKVYLADPAIAPSVMLKGRRMLEDGAALGAGVEAAFFKHAKSALSRLGATFSFWRGSQDREVDFIAEMGGRVIPFEVKYRAGHTGAGDLKGLADFCSTRDVKRGYVITRSIDDCGVLDLPLSSGAVAKVAKVPAPLACLLLGMMEVDPPDTSMV
ncbi:MAG: ATP-binding protein [Planctomycetes bacterium]|nr:ATP-binding protein [Planctomycetota bacterium]